MGGRLVEEILAALPAQTVVVPGAKAAEIVLPKLADSLKSVLLQRKQIAEDIERMFDDHPLAKVLTSMPGVGVRTGARILLEVGDGSDLTALHDPASRRYYDRKRAERQEAQCRPDLLGSTPLRRPLRHAPQ